MASMKYPLSGSDNGSNGSMTEEERESGEDDSKQSVAEKVTCSPAIIDDDTGAPTRQLTTKRSFWDVIRGAPMTTASCDPVSQPCTDSKPEENIVEQLLDASSEVKSIDKPIDVTPRLQKRRSFAPFPTLNISWSKASRRHTVTSMVDSAIPAPLGAMGAERSLDGSIHLPHNINEARVADDAVRFADARHVIRTEQDIDVIRNLAERLEQGWREKQLELAEIRAKLGEAQLHLHDVKDETKHLRSQLGTMSEQIVARDNDFKELQKLIVDQSKKEREIWEMEKRQEVEAVEEKLKAAQRKIQDHRERYFDSEEDDDEDGRDVILFSANTSIDEDVFSRQSETKTGAVVAAAPLTTPTTPTLQITRGQFWSEHFMRTGVDTLRDRLDALQGATNGSTTEV